MKQQEKKEPQQTLGQRLRRERELRGIELDEVSRVTRVRLAYLQHLENDRLSDLPADVYSRGYIRAYAGFLGIDGERCVEQYQKQAPARGVSPAVAFEKRYGKLSDRPLPALQEGRSEPAATATSTGGMPAGGGAAGRSRLGLALVIVMLFCAALLIAGVYYVNRSDAPGPDSKNKPPTTKNEKDRFFLDS